MRVNHGVSLNGKPQKEFDQTMYVDDGGQVLMSKSELFGGMAMYRTTKQGAMLPDQALAGQFDQIANSVIKVPRLIKDYKKTRNVRYKVTIKEDNVADLVPADRRQTLSVGSNTSVAFLDVKTAGPNIAGTDPTPDPAYSQPNALINSDDARVIELTRKAVGNAASPWDQAVRIEKWVAHNLTEKNFKTAFAPAAEVAVNLTGDCTEHAVLTAAMCRAAGIPARVVVGLVYADELKGFGYHMWNEVYVNRHWVAIDAAYDEDDVDAVHIKLSESSLEGVSPFETFLPIVKVLGKMSIEPLEIR